MSVNQQRSYLNSFRIEVKEKLNEIYAREQSLLAISTDDSELQDLLESYDEDFSQPYIDVLYEEVNNFKNNKIDDAY